MTQSTTPAPFTRWRIFSIALLGTVTEYFDYSIYGFSAALIGKQFFPSSDPTTTTLQAFLLFAIASFAKPIGGYLLGYLGDRHGRSYALKISMLGVSLPTMLIGLLPTYSQWGIAAPILLLLCRMLQAGFIAGDFDGVSIFIQEHTRKRWPYLSHSLVVIAINLGIALGSLTIELFQEFDPSVRWRYPFLIGSLASLGVWAFRQFLVETPEFLRQAQSKPLSERSPTFAILMKTIHSARGPFSISLLLCGCVGGIYQFYFIFWPNFLGSILTLYPPELLQHISSLQLIVYTLASPAIGYLADRYGFKKLLLTSLALLPAAFYANLKLFDSIDPLLPHLLTVTAMLPVQVCTYVLLIQLFAVQQRFKLLALSHTLGSMLLSGTAPLLATFLWKSSQAFWLPLLYFFLLLFTSIIASYLLCRRIGNDTQIQ
jgi:MHS family proline/betaine transporter-like MFS transporter